MNMTATILKTAYSTKLQVQLFNERHGPKRVANLDQVMIAMQRIGIIGKPWPTRTEATAMVNDIQAELERIVP